MVAPDHGVVEFEFLEIAVEFSSGCEYDYIQVRYYKYLSWEYGVDRKICHEGH